MAETPELTDMVEHVDWMSPIHYEILEFFNKHDIWISARGLSSNIEYDRNYTSRELNTLSEADLLEKEGTVYGLSERGREFLSGELTADDLQEPGGE